MAGYPVQIDSLPPGSDYHVLVTPTIGNTPTPEIVIDGESAAGTDYVPHFLRVTVNAGDDVAAATRLMSGFPEVALVQPGETLEITSEAVISDVYLIGVTLGAGGAAVDIDTFADYAYLIGRGDTDAADWLAQMARFRFDSTDNVRRVLVTLTEAVDTNIKIVKVQGVSYA